MFTMLVGVRRGVNVNVKDAAVTQTGVSEADKLDVSGDALKIVISSSTQNGVAQELTGSLQVL
jgi:hypothetical protein